MNRVSHRIFMLGIMPFVMMGCSQNYGIKLQQQLASLTGGSAGTGTNSQTGTSSNSSTNTLTGTTSSTGTGTSTNTATTSSTSTGTGTGTGVGACINFGTGGSGTAQNGIQGTLMYFSPTASTTYGAAVCDSSASTCANSWKPTSVANFFNPSPLGTSSSQQPALPILGSSNVWVSNFNFITQYYTTGFTDNSGNALQAGGSTMNEYFGLKFNGLIQIPSGVLPAGTTNAQYQFALVSDDGATLSINNQMIVNGDGTHASKMSCFSTPTGTTPTLVTLSTTTAVPFELQYYEGPRCEIALMMLYRKVPTAGNIADTLCALPQSNTLLFTPPQNSTCTSGSTIPWTPNTNSPTTANNNYTTLVADGWAPVPPTWFVLPPNTTNTCAAAP